MHSFVDVLNLKSSPRSICVAVPRKIVLLYVMCVVIFILQSVPEVMKLKTLTCQYSAGQKSCIFILWFAHIEVFREDDIATFFSIVAEIDIIFLFALFVANCQKLFVACCQIQHMAL